jgi:DNA-binding response OmpR family regulator
MARILLLGLEKNLADQLGYVLSADHHEVRTGECLDDGNRNGADVIFSSGEDGAYKRHLNDAKRCTPEPPLVVVTRLPEAAQWLDALEAGATDYCAAPFERRQIRWILDSALRAA